MNRHPDDAEAWCAGTLALLADRGWKITIATMTAGGMGSYSMSERETVSVRQKEAAAAAGAIDAEHAECYWQHLGGGFPREPIIQDELSEFIHHRKGYTHEHN